VIYPKDREVVGADYSGMLVVGETAAVVKALRAEGVKAAVAGVGKRRTAVIPAEEHDLFDVAAALSGKHGFAVLAHMVREWVALWVYRKGEIVHEYVSDQDAFMEVVDTEDGIKVAFDGMVYPIEDVPRPGPSGADSGPFLFLADGEADGKRLTWALSQKVLDAEERHEMIIAALHLKRDPLVVGYHHLEHLGEQSDLVFVS
jgi:hypothetical protein